MQGGSCAEIWCSESRWLLSLREGDGLGSRSRRGPLPHMFPEQLGTRSRDFHLAVQLVLCQGPRIFGVFTLRADLTERSLSVNHCARNVFFEGSVLVWFCPRISLGLAFAQRTGGRVSRMSLWLRAAEGDVNYTGVLSCATYENSALSREWPF